MADCKTCKHKGTNTHHCDECSSDYDMYERKIVTNAMRIRSMSDEELADFINRKIACNCCSAKHCNSDKSCEVDILQWLQSEAE